MNWSYVLGMVIGGIVITLLWPTMEKFATAPTTVLERTQEHRKEFVRTHNAQHALIIFWHDGRQTVTAPITAQACDIITQKILEHGTSWDVWSCPQIGGFDD